MKEQTRHNYWQIVKTALIALAVFAGGFLLHTALEISYLSLFLVVVVAVYLTRYISDFKRLLLPLGLFIVIIAVSAKLVIKYSANTPFLSHYFIPVTAVVMLTTLLFEDLQITFAIALISAALAGKIAADSIELTAIFLIGGLIAGLVTYHARRRSQIIRAGLLVGIMQSFCLLLIYLTRGIDLTDLAFLQHSIPVLSSGILSSILVLGSLPIFEYLFKITTNISLLELSDFNHPLLKQMIIEAPGTYQHSLVVGNLSEAAAEAIGCNALLARVGAYYHDIGKIAKSEYFSENQMFVSNKHDNLQPNISRLIIINHVKDGLDIARKYRLNSILQEFIEQHHGTSLMHYFYMKALEDTTVVNQVAEEGFRYPGPKPRRKEVAVVLLADSVEAASRALAEPTPERLTESVHKIINNKFIDGQLDACQLTLNDLNTIAATFVRILSAIYHGRIAYPEYPEKKYDNHKEHPKEDSHSAPAPKESHPTDHPPS